MSRRLFRSRYRWLWRSKRPRIGYHKKIQYRIEYNSDVWLHWIELGWLVIYWPGKIIEGGN